MFERGKSSVLTAIIVLKKCPLCTQSANKFSPKMLLLSLQGLKKWALACRGQVGSHRFELSR